MKIAIVDDDNKCRDEICHLIKSFDKSYIVDTFCSGDSFLKSNANDYQIVFLDIEMPGINGIEVGQIIREKGSFLEIFYVTNHNSYISDALRNQPFQYFTKPIDPEVFKKDFNRAIEKAAKSKTIFKITWNNNVIGIPIGEITYIEFQLRKLHFFTSDKKEHLSLGKISDMKGKLEEYGFVQCHKSFLGAMKYILEISKDTIVLTNGTTIPLSKNFRQKVKEKYNLFLAGVSL